MDDLPYSEADIDLVRQNAGIEMLRKKLEKTLISKHRELKIAGIEKDYLQCKTRINQISETAIQKSQDEILLAKQGAEKLKEQLSKAMSEKRKMEDDNQKIRDAAEELKKEIMKNITDLERKSR